MECSQITQVQRNLHPGRILQTALNSDEMCFDGVWGRWNVHCAAGQSAAGSPSSRSPSALRSGPGTPGGSASGSHAGGRASFERQTKLAA